MNVSSVRKWRNGASAAVAATRRSRRSAREGAVTCRSRPPEEALHAFRDRRRSESEMLLERLERRRRAEPGHPDPEAILSQELAPILRARGLDHDPLRRARQNALAIGFRLFPERLHARHRHDARADLG